MIDFAFISPMPGQAEQARLEGWPVRGLRPDAGGVVAEVRGDHGAQGLDLPGHRTREAMQGRALAEDGVQRCRIHRRDPGGVEMPKPALQVGRAAECLLDSHLLVEREADQQGQRLLDEQAVGGVIAGERERGRHRRHGRMVVAAR